MPLLIIPQLLITRCKSRQQISQTHLRCLLNLWLWYSRFLSLWFCWVFHLYLIYFHLIFPTLHCFCIFSLIRGRTGRSFKGFTSDILMSKEEFIDFLLEHLLFLSREGFDCMVWCFAALSFYWCVKSERSLVTTWEPTLLMIKKQREYMLHFRVGGVLEFRVLWVIAAMTQFRCNKLLITYLTLKCL